MNKDIPANCENPAILLKERQQYSLDGKIYLSEQRIKEWYEYWDGQVYVSFSGGKDSTVLLHLVRSLYPEVPAIFVDTGLEYPEIKEFVRAIDNVTWLRPQYSYRQIIERWGFPIISKDQSCAISRYRNTNDPIQKYRRLHGWPSGKKGMISKKWQWLIDAPFKISDACCQQLKKYPLDKYAKKANKHPMIGMMAQESHNRKFQYYRYGCNAFTNKKPVSWPLAFWLEEDVWDYLRKFDVPYSKIYDMGEKRTGCMWCMFGVHMEDEPNRFQRMKQTHPKIYDYCINKLNLGEVLDYINVNYK